MVAVVSEPSPRFAVEALPASEFLISLATMTDASALDALEVGPSWIAATERLAGSSLLASARTFCGESKYPWIKLLHFAVSKAGGDIRSMIDFLEQADPRLTLRHVIGYYDPVIRARLPVAVLDAALNGDPSAVAVIGATSDLSWPRSLVERPAHESVACLVEILRGWHARVWTSIEAVTMPALARDVNDKGLRWEASRPEAFIAQATQGVTWSSFAQGTSWVILVPTYVGRPWVAHTEALGTTIIVYPVADSSLGPKRDVEVRRLGRLSVAMRAPNREAILRELWRRPLTLQELTSCVGCPSDSLLQTLLSMRAAGFVTVDAVTHRYALNNGELNDLGGLVGAYLEVGSEVARFATRAQSSPLPQ
jgi:hypothetical protein